MFLERSVSSVSPLRIAIINYKIATVVLMYDSWLPTLWTLPDLSGYQSRISRITISKNWQIYHFGASCLTFLYSLLCRRKAGRRKWGYTLVWRKHRKKKHRFGSIVGRLIFSSLKLVLENVQRAQEKPLKTRRLCLAIRCVNCLQCLDGLGSDFTHQEAKRISLRRRRTIANHLSDQIWDPI